MPEILTDAYLLFTFVFKQALKENQNIKRSQKRYNLFLKESKEFHVTDRVAGINNYYQLIIDESAQKLVYMEFPWEKIIVPLSKILSVEIYAYNDLIAKIPSNSEVNISLLADLYNYNPEKITDILFETHKNEKTRDISVRITIDNSSCWGIWIDCFNIYRESNHKEFKTNPALFPYRNDYKQGIKDAIKILKILKETVNKNNSEIANYENT